MTSLSNGVYGARHLLLEAGAARPSEIVLLIFDQTTVSLINYFVEAADSAGLHLELIETAVALNHGEEPSPSAAQKMLQADLVIALTSFSLAHSKARVECSEKARFLSLPQYSEDLLSDPMVMMNYESLAPETQRLSKLLTNGKLATLITPGSKLEILIEGRTANNCPAFVRKPGDLGSPPDVEVNVSPLESGSNGKVVIDGSITHPRLGLLDTEVEIRFVDGVAKSFSTSNDLVKRTLEDLFEGDFDRRGTLAELGVGLNPLAHLTGAMLSDEGTRGTVHLGLGSNIFVGGKNSVDFHLDFVIRQPELFIDGIRVVSGGKIWV